MERRNWDYRTNRPGEVVNEIIALRAMQNLESSRFLSKMGFDNLVRRYSDEYDMFVKHLARETAINGVPQKPERKEIEVTYYEGGRHVHTMKVKMDSKQKEENDMARGKGKGNTNPAVKKEEMTYLRAYQIFSMRMWPEEEDQPDFTGMTEDQAKMELEENISLLTPEDKDEVLSEAPEDGQAAWNLFCSIRKDLVEKKAPATPSDSGKGKTKAPEAPKADKRPSKSTRMMQLMVDGFLASGEVPTVEAVIDSMASEGLEISKGTVSIWRTDMVKIMDYIASRDVLKK